MNYLNLNIGTRRRLDALKRAAEKLNTGHNLRKQLEDPTPYTWRDVRRSKFNTFRASCCTLSQGSNGRTPIWYAHTGEQFPRERYVDECDSVKIEHTGWYSDTHQDSKTRGLVVALPHGRFLAGYETSDNGERVYFGDIYDEDRTAAYAADSSAERQAEDAREWYEQYQAARDLEEENESNLQRLRECLALRNRACFAALRTEARDLITRIRDVRDTLRTDYAAHI